MAFHQGSQRLLGTHYNAHRRQGLKRRRDTPWKQMIKISVKTDELVLV